jgi:uncharacterized protein YcfL
MRNVFYFWICIAMWLLSACSSQKKEDRGDIQVLMKDSVDANGLQRMQYLIVRPVLRIKVRNINRAWFAGRMTVCLL